MFRFGYNTNGLAHHRVLDALELLAELGYEGVALTPDAGCLDPFALDEREVEDVCETAAELGLSLSVETGARFVLDRRRKHFPTLLEAGERDRERRVDFLRRCVDLAVELGASPVSFWSGAASGEPDRLWDRLCAGVESVLDHARGSGVDLAFEPEPGMFIERPDGYLELRQLLGVKGAELGLCLDVGHLLCTGDLPVGDTIRRLGPHLAMVHLDDIRDGVHEHRMFGQGDLDLPETLNALLDVGYRGMAAVELSRDSHRGPLAAEEALGHLKSALRAP